MAVVSRLHLPGELLCLAIMCSKCGGVTVVAGLATTDVILGGK